MGGRKRLRERKAGLRRTISMASTKSIMERRKKLLGRLFTVDRSGTPVQYSVRPGMETEAAASWKEHGVCPVCSLRAISGGRCIQCGWESYEERERIAKFVKGGK